MIRRVAKMLLPFIGRTVKLEFKGNSFTAWGDLSLDEGGNVWLHQRGGASYHYLPDGTNIDVKTPGVEWDIKEVKRFD